MNDTTTAAKATKVKNFGRTYNYDTRTVAIAVMGKPDTTLELAYDKLPEAVQRAFALQAYADFVVQSGNDVIREGGTVDDGVADLSRSIADAEGGKIEFRDGMGLGMSSAPAAALVGRALVEGGYSFVAFKGVRSEFAGDVGKAQDAMRALYADTTENTTDEHKLTGRQFFGRIAKQEKVAALVASYKKSKPVAALDLG